MSEHDKAVALAKAHNQTGLRADLILGHERAKWFPAALADHRQQIIEELAQRSGVMPEAHNDPDGGLFCWADEVREAIASLEARITLLAEQAALQETQSLQVINRLHGEAADLRREFGQSEARVLELEKDAARYQYLRAKKHYAILVGEEGFGCSFAQVEHWSNEQNAAKVDEFIDAAINKERGK